MNIIFSFVLVSLAILTLLSISTYMTTDMIVNASTDQTNEIFQIPSEPTDFPGNNQDLVDILFVKANKDSIDNYHVLGSIKNVGTETLNSVRVTAHFFDKDLNPIGITTCCYADPSDIEPQHTSAFDSFVSADSMIGEPSYFRLSFDWRLD